jgi:hypothetical protein
VDLARRAGTHGRGDAAVNDAPQAALLVLRDPDRIQIEVCSWKAQDPY